MISRKKAKNAQKVERDLRARFFGWTNAMGASRLRWRISNHWKNQSGIFQPLETVDAGGERIFQWLENQAQRFPMLGKTEHRVSKVWNFFFQGLENGSKVWKTEVRGIAR